MAAILSTSQCLTLKTTFLLLPDLCCQYRMNQVIFGTPWYGDIAALTFLVFGFTDERIVILNIHIRTYYLLNDLHCSFMKEAHLGGIPTIISLFVCNEALYHNDFMAI